MTGAEADPYRHRPSAYVHIPFCSSVCPYCDFAVVAGGEDRFADYTAALIDEIGMSPSRRPLSSVYFGGGTPSRLPPDSLAAVLDALADRHGIESGAEISLEANPEDFDIDLARRLVHSGFNRISFGAQSLDPVVLDYLGRRHDPGGVAVAVGAAREAGLVNISLDLIFGSPVEDDRSWEATVGGALALGPVHLSCYALTVERGTPLGRAVAAGAAAPDPDVQADRWEQADRLLRAAGLERYEVSNWARPGYECRYNLTVWAQGEYEAYGNGAHRYVGGSRSRNHRRLNAYLAEIGLGRRPVAGSDPIEGREAEVDRLFVGLRRTVGVADGPGVRAFLDSDWGARLVDAGVVEFSGGRLRVMRPLLGDEVARAVLALGDGAVQAAAADNV